MLSASFLKSQNLEHLTILQAAVDSDIARSAFSMPGSVDTDLEFDLLHSMLRRFTCTLRPGELTTKTQVLLYTVAQQNHTWPSLTLKSIRV